MTARSILIIIAVVLLFTCKSQQSSGNTWDWATKFNFTGVESDALIGGQDKAGNLYCAVLSIRSSAKKSEVYYQLLKLSPNGTLIWSKQISDYTRAPMVTDSDGNTYLAINDRMAKVNSNGDFIWQKSANSQRFFFHIFLKSGNPILSGVEQNGQTFISKYSTDGDLISSVYGHIGGHTKLSETGYVIYTPDMPDPITGNGGRLRKYDKVANLLFEKVVPHGYKDMIIDDAENIYLAGQYSSIPIQIDGQKFSTPQNLYSSYNYIIKYDPNGNLLWYKIMTGGDSRNISMQIDEQNNLYYSTNIFGESKFNGSLVNQTGPALLVGKFDPEGTPIWYEKVAGNPSLEHLLINSQKQIYVAGRFTGSFTAGTNVAGPTEHYMYAEMFVAKLSQYNSVGIVDKTNAAQMWNVYPNPSGSVFSLQGPLDVKGKLLITDINGRTLNEKELNEGLKDYSVDLSIYPKGVYLLQIRTQAGIETKKLIKN